MLSLFRRSQPKDTDPAAPAESAGAEPERRSFLGRLFASLLGLFWSPQLPHAALIEFARSVRFFLVTGMTLRDAMATLARLGTRRVRTVAEELREELSSGWSFEAALEKQKHRFPPLFIAFATVGEETGNLPEVMKDLEGYYELHIKQRRQLASAALRPMIQFVLATIVIAGLIYILSLLPPLQITAKAKAKDAQEAAANAEAMMDHTTTVPNTFDVTGLGLYGERGAVLFLVYVYGALFGIYVLYRLLGLILRRRAILERLLLNIPFIGTGIMAIALSRFSFALQLTLDSSISVVKSIRMAFTATDNAAFSVAGPKAEAVLKRGNTVTTALTAARLFPEDFISAAAVAEESGHLPEVMRQKAEYYTEIAELRLGAMYATLGYIVWISVAGFIGVMIIRLFKSTYGAAIPMAEKFMSGSGG